MIRQWIVLGSLWVLIVGAVQVPTITTLTSLVGREEAYVVAVMGPADTVRKTPFGETWFYPLLCLEFTAQGRVLSGCVKQEHGSVCYYDGTQQRPSERSCAALGKP